MLALQQVFNVARQLVHPQVADRNPKVVAGDFFQFVRFVEDNGPALGKDTGVGRAIGFQFDGEVGEEQVVVDDDDVALGRAPPHLGDEAAVKLAALLPGASLGPSVELVPNRACLGQFREFRAIPGARGFLPCGDGAVVLDLFQSAEHRLAGQVVEFLTAQIIVAPLHVADAELSIAFGKQRSLQRRDVFEEELLLQILRSGRDDDALA